MGSKINEVCFFSVLILFCLDSVLCDQLEVGYYKESCPSAELIVRDVVRDACIKNPGVAPGLLRMLFHDCFVRGCDGSVLLDSTPTNTAEKDSPINNPSLRGFEVIDEAKARLEYECKGIVSCADILAFAARDSVVLTGGNTYAVPAGRRDGRVSLASETFTNIPSPTFNLNQLTQNFANKGLTQEEMVILSGAHTIGRSHCTIITTVDDRLYNFNNTGNQDPSLDAIYAARLKQQCPQGNNDSNLVVPMDPNTPGIVDVSYYINIDNNRGLFTSDQSLLTSQSTASQVNQFAWNQLLWKNKFASALVKMGQIGVLTGNLGEIRANCRVVNS